MKRWKFSIIISSTLGLLAIGTSSLWLGYAYGRHSYAVEFSSHQPEIAVTVSRHELKTQAPIYDGSVIRMHTERGVVVMPGRADDWHQAENAFALGESVSNFEAQTAQSAQVREQDLASSRN